MAVIRRLAGTVHTGVEPIEGLTAKYHLRRGNKRVLVGLRHHPVELAKWWDKFPYAQKFLKPRLRRAGLSMNDPEAVLHVLDPILGSYRDEQVLVHRALLRDQRQLLELLRMAEAWLETKAMMRSRWGGRRQKGCSVDAVGRYAILSVRPTRTLKAKPAPNPS